VLDGALLVQAALLCWLEEALYGGDHEEVTYNMHSMYPPWLVAATSGEGRAACEGGGGRGGGGGRVCVLVGAEGARYMPLLRGQGFEPGMGYSC
jgi:hypothetical protein